jgi:hypothetical protein
VRDNLAHRIILVEPEPDRFEFKTYKVFMDVFNICYKNYTYLIPQIFLSAMKGRGTTSFNPVGVVPKVDFGQPQSKITLPKAQLFP